MSRLAKHAFQALNHKVEWAILAIGLVCTIFGKVLIYQRQPSADSFASVIYVISPDLLFFAACALVISTMYAIKPSAVTARIVLLAGMCIVFWSVLNTGWLIRSGVQLQIGIVKVLIRDFNEIWPLVQSHLFASAGRFALLVLVTIFTISVCIWFLVRPGKVVSKRSHHIRRSVILMVMVFVLSFVSPILKANTEYDFSEQVLAFSSHWHVLSSTILNFRQNDLNTVSTRNIPIAGQREIGAGQADIDNLPNVVLIMLESVSYSSTSLSENGPDTTPNLSDLARHGIEFVNTRVPVSHTTKALWATLTSTTPVIEPDYVEAVPVEKQYESLATILSRYGYRSGFFEMSKGSYECAPGLFNNLGFDWAWFRENLQDPSAHLGYMSGDDCRVIEPAFKWALGQSSPFLMTMITTAAHDPFEVPEWFGKTPESTYDKYLQTVRYTDYFLGEVCRKLEESGIADNTILCVIGDHGTSFRGRAENGRWIPYEEVIRVPWVIHWPAKIKKSQRFTWPCSQLDVTPTILNMIGFETLSAGFEGMDAGVPIADDRDLYFSSWYLDSPIGYVSGNEKVVYWPAMDKLFKYNLSVDSLEEKALTMGSDESKAAKDKILKWQSKSQIEIDAKRCTDQILYSNWQTFSAGTSAWAYYLPVH